MRAEEDTVTIEVTVGIKGKDCEKTIQRTYSKQEWDDMRYEWEKEEEVRNIVMNQIVWEWRIK